MISATGPVSQTHELLRKEHIFDRCSQCKSVCKYNDLDVVSIIRTAGVEEEF